MYVSIVLPLDMLWTDADPDEYNADATEQNFVDAFRRNLHQAGYESDVKWSNVVSATFQDESGGEISGSIYNELHAILDNTPANYVLLEDS